MNEEPSDKAAFDAYANDYESALNRGLAVSGESKDFFAQGRVARLRSDLHRLGLRSRRILDFGCGTGTAIPFLLELPGVEEVVGVDVSESSLDVAKRSHPDPRVQVETLGRFAASERFDLVYCNGVFHHIPPPERPGAVQTVHRALTRGGVFSLWENNPWNPGTRYVMSRIPFDRDAITLSPPETRRMVEREGFSVLHTRSLFWFPRSLGFLRPVEPWLAPIPLGAQYQVLSVKSP